MFKVLKKYKECPRCKTFYPAIWKKCNICNSPLINSWVALILWFFKKACFLAAVVFLFALFCLFSYSLQKSERKFYERSYHQLREGKFQDAWHEFGKAFWHNPLSNVSRSTVGKIKKAFADLKYTGPHLMKLTERACLYLGV